MNQITQRLVFYGLPAVAMGTAWVEDKPPYGRPGKRRSRHDAQYKPWRKANHRQAMAALDAGEKTQTRKKAGLDSDWPHAEESCTPFNPEVDPKYKFKFKETVCDDKSVHKHFRLEGIFFGKPVASFYNEFQKHATPPKNKKE